LTDRNSFNSITKWIQDLKNHIDSFSMIIVGNKADLVDQRVVKFEEAETLANSLGVKYFETSIYVDKMGKDGTKIHNIF
jgi:GTPase SAR1 family protein